MLLLFVYSVITQRIFFKLLVFFSNFKDISELITPSSSLDTLLPPNHHTTLKTRSENQRFRNKYNNLFSSFLRSKNNVFITSGNMFRIKTFR